MTETDSASDGVVKEEDIWTELVTTPSGITIWRVEDKKVGGHYWASNSIGGGVVITHSIYASPEELQIVLDDYKKLYPERN